MVTRAEIENAVRKIEIIGNDFGYDPEVAHLEADAVLLAVVPKQIRDAYIALSEKTEWWSAA